MASDEDLEPGAGAPACESDEGWRRAQEQAFELPVRELMTPAVVCAAPGDTVALVAARMSSLRISCVLVTDPERRPVGVVTERDLVRAVTEPEKFPTIGDIMTSPVHTVGADHSLAHAIDETAKREIRRLAVVDERGCVQGVVTQTDLLRAHVAQLERLVHERTRALQITNSQLWKLSREDGLLGIGNRHALKEDLERVHAVAARYARGYAVAVLDIDYFKTVNDQHGHARGDDVLRAVADHIEANLRAADALYRMGGDEFLVSLAETELEGAARVTERIRATVEHHRDELCGVTVSCGVAAYDSDARHDADPWGVIARADRALYGAKDRGRNCVQVAQD